MAKGVKIALIVVVIALIAGLIIVNFNAITDWFTSVGNSIKQFFVNIGNWFTTQWQKLIDWTKS